MRLWLLKRIGDFGGKGARGPVHWKDGRSSRPAAQQRKIRGLIGTPWRFADRVGRTSETGIGQQIVPAELEEDRFFDQLLARKGCIIEGVGLVWS
jgi:hypothetical protein